MTSENHNKRAGRRGGNALLLAIVVTMLLFILGMAFLSSTLTEKTTVFESEHDAALNNVLDEVINKINEVLVSDLFDNQGKFLNGNAAYDYPDDNNKWLASLEPEYNDNGTLGFPNDDWYYWRHITDLGSLWGRNFDWKVPYYHPDDYNNPDQWDRDKPEISDRYWVRADNVMIRIVQEDEAIKPKYMRGNTTTPEWSDPGWTGPIPPVFIENIGIIGTLADADGDGVADSRWVRRERVGPEGKWLWAAVRIIDNGGMININTAYRDPTATGGQWDGSLLTHVNLDTIVTGPTPHYWGIRARTEPVSENVDKLHLARCNGFPITEMDYYLQVGRRLKNPIPGPGYIPFDISDELELRNRFLVDSPVIARLGAPYISPTAPGLWQTTFDPAAGPVGVDLPYYDPTTIDNWFEKVTCTYVANPIYSGLPTIGWTPVTCTIGNYNRRTISTTYSYDRVVAPWRDEGGMPPGIRDAPNGWRSWTKWNDPNPYVWNYRPICVNDYDSSHATYDPVNWPTKPTLQQIAAAIWLGLPDNDLNNEPSIAAITTIQAPNWNHNQTRQHISCQMAVNLVDYIDGDTNSTKLSVGGDEYFGFESGNQLYIHRLGVSKFDPAPLDAADVETHYAIVLYNPGNTDIDLQNWKVHVPGEAGTPFDIETTANTKIVLAGGICVLIDEDDPGPDEGFKISDFSNAGALDESGFKFDDNDRIVLLDNNDCVADAVTVKIGSGDIDDPSSSDTVEVWDTDLVEKRHVGYGTNPNHRILVWESERGSWNGPDLSPGNLDTLSSWSGSRVTAAIQTRTANDKLVTIGEISNVLAVGAMKIGNNYITMSECWDTFIKDADGGNNDIASINRGRLDLSRTNMAGLLRYLTVFAPFSDKVDNDGNGFLDDPLHDLIDNDGANGIDDAGEAVVFTEFNELTIAGRININTAPWFAIAQLPWIQDPSLAYNSPDKFRLAHAITAYRDKLSLSGLPFDGPDYTLRIGGPGFISISELLNVNDPGSFPYDRYSIQYHKITVGDLAVMPDLTPNDGSDNDIEERDIIFHRISNLVTVRSDVFTAYILVRLGTDGPQKRVIAIFDRSNVFSTSDKPKLVALHPVPDPR